MWYAIISEDVEDSLPLRKIHRPAHVARLKALHAENRVLAGGPNPINDNDFDGDGGISGSVLILNFESLEDAKAWAADDPYIHGGVHSKSVVKPFSFVLPGDK